MNILTVQLGHNSTVLLMSNGKVLNAVSQEKFDNIKNSSSFPCDAIDWVLNENKISPSDIDIFGICSLSVYPQQLTVLDESNNSYIVTSRIREIYNSIDYLYGFNKCFGIFKKLKFANDTNMMVAAKEKLIEIIAEKYGIVRERVDFVEHHICHAYSPAYFEDRSDKDWLILTMDGAGDKYFCSVNTFKEGVVTRVSNTPWEYSLGYVYSLTTKFLGMKPLEHEYKVMGLAAYAKKNYFEKTLNKVFKDTAWLKKDDSLEFSSRFPLNRFERHLQKVCVGERFDNVAGALQQFLEDLVLDWVKSAIEKTGIHNVMTSGGVFMNVKLNKLIQELPEVEDVWFMPSCGDESNPFGAAYAIMEKHGREKLISPLGHIYLGHEYSNEEVGLLIEKNSIGERYNVQFYKDIEDIIAKMLADFHVVARFAGKAEFGARSLGNRAILANPSDMKSFYTVNDLIKARDFWMPFAPSILDTDAGRYLVNPKKVESPYMITAFDTTLLAHQHLRAAMHQGDKTVRPQIVTEQANLRYYSLIKKFKDYTGIGGILNTSFNLHGYPLAATLDQAIFTFENSGLRHLALENFLISKL